jgi:uncharacterized membrane protein
MPVTKVANRNSRLGAGLPWSIDSVNVRASHFQRRRVVVGGRMAQFCTACGAQIPEGAAVCPACGRGLPTGAATSPAPAPVSRSTGGLADNLAGALSYITFIPAVIFLVLEPYNKNRFVRFHAFQCLFLTAACIALGIVFSILGVIPVLNLLMIPVAIIVWIGVIILALVLILKAFQGEMFKVPVLGDLAEKQANSL